MKPFKIHFTNPKDSKEYFIQDFKTYVESPDFNKELFLDRLVQICNQEKIYNILFKTMLQAQKYPKEKAVQFFDYAKKGWKEKINFVFLIIRVSEGQLCGAIEVKSNDLERSEIGYWASEDAHGIMTLSLKHIIKEAKSSGYKSLFARILTTNEASMTVVKNNGFVNMGFSKNENDGIKRNVWERIIK